MSLPTDEVGRQPALEVERLVKAYPDRKERVLAVDDISFQIEEGSFYTLLGPSGCGKTTTLRCVAGLERPDGGAIRVGGKVMSEARSRQYVRPHRRPMGMVFQNYAIWPHLSVFDNAAFPLRVSPEKLSSTDLKRRVEEALELVQLERYIHRPATNLSGGQQQRLALARALIRRPQILLLDEPLSNLDAKLRNAMRAELRSVQRRIKVTTLYVTHDQAEALSLSNRIAVMEGGKIIQEGTPREIYGAPQSVFVANFIGESNFLEGKVVGSGLNGCMCISTPAGELEALCPPEVQAGDAVTLGVRPHEFVIERATARASNLIEGTIAHLYFLGDHIDYRVRAGEVDLSVRLPVADSFSRGDTVHLVIPKEKISVFSNEHGVGRVTSPAAELALDAIAE